MTFDKQGDGEYFMFVTERENTKLLIIFEPPKDKVEEIRKEGRRNNPNDQAFCISG